MYVNRAQVLLLVGTVATVATARDQVDANDEATGRSRWRWRVGASGDGVAATGMGQDNTTNNGGSTLEGATINQGKVYRNMSI